MLEKNITFGDLCKMYGGVNCEDFLANFPVRTEGKDPSVVSLLAYIGSIDFQQDQKDLMLDIEEALYHEEGIDCIVITREDTSGKYGLRINFLPWTIT